MNNIQQLTQAKKIHGFYKKNNKYQRFFGILLRKNDDG